ncbi:MAG: helix-turn-helix domain-containing protein [Lachnospiraceae bacterium]|nr:helix-turn-helix domain-containing protein [Lachnospiraceae bacterium]
MGISKKYYELQALDLWDFPTLVRKAREIQHITLEDLCKGICSFSMIGRIERGERFPDKELRDRILARLGVCSDGYENFLFREDYLVWKRKQGIVNAIEKSNYETAEDLLKYYDETGDTDKLGRQFELVMRAQMMQKRHESTELIAQMCEKAVKLTVPDLDDQAVGELCLSVQELDMILEYTKYCHPEKLASRCEEILMYIKSDVFDIYSYVKIYPKVVYYLYISTPEADRDWTRTLRLCNDGVEQLRTAGRMYYLWELLEIKKEGMTKLYHKVGDSKGAITKQTLENIINTTAEWLDALDFVHSLCGTNRKMESSCYLYQQKEAYCISDVIRRRREMLGLTKKKLCEGVCSEKTIGRLEANKTKPQIDVVRQLFEKMNLSGEYQRWQVVTNDVRAFPIYDEIRRSANNREFETIKTLLIDLEKYVPMENPINKQYKERIEVIVERRQGKISKEEAKRQLIEILEYTIPYEVAIKSGTKYLTNVEIQILLDIAINIGREDMNCAFEALAKLCEQMELDEGILEHIAVRETIMTTIANVYGEMGEYTKADMINFRTMQECIYCYRMHMLVPNLYGIIWNNGERFKKNLPIEERFKEKEYLYFCLILCRINKDIVKEAIVKRKLKDM